MKTRFNKPFESVQVKIPYETGMNPYSGLVDMAEKANLLVKDGNRLRFGEGADEIKLFRKAWESNEDGCLDKLMIVYAKQASKLSSVVEREELESLPSAVDDGAEVMTKTKLMVDGHGDVHEISEE